MMSIRSLADFNGAPPGRCSDWLAPPPSPPRAHAPGRHDERGMGTSTWPPAGTYTWPSTRTFPWPSQDWDDGSTERVVATSIHEPGQVARASRRGGLIRLQAEPQGPSAV